MDDLISRQAAIDAMMALQKEDTEAYGCDIPEGFDGKRAAEALKRLPTAQQWTPCSEGVPEDEYVLISKKPSKISGSKWCVTIAERATDPRSKKVQWRDIGFGVIQDDKVLAWMPRPEPYEP